MKPLETKPVSEEARNISSFFFFRTSFVSGVIEHGTCPLPTADSRIVCNERRGKCSVNICSVLVLVSY